MNEFRILPNTLSQRNERKLRVVLWGAAFVLGGIALFSLYGARSAGRDLNLALTCVAVLMVVSAIVGTHVFVVRRGLEKIKSDLVYVLTDTDLIRRRSGWPDVRIGLAEIKALSTGGGWLVVKSGEPRRTIAVPEEVEGYERLRSELAKIGPAITIQRPSPLRLIPTVATLFCWALVLLSRDRGVVKSMAVVGLALLGWESFLLVRGVRRNAKRFLLWTWIGLTWFAALLLVYLRVVRS